VTTRAENIGLDVDYENEIEFHFQLELYRAGRRPVNKLKMPRLKSISKMGMPEGHPAIRFAPKSKNLTTDYTDYTDQKDHGSF
jgi:hypothetical protein